MYDITSVSLGNGALTLNVPFIRLVVLVWVPLMRMVTPGSVPPSFASTTRPETRCPSCAGAGEAATLNSTTNIVRGGAILRKTTLENREATDEAVAILILRLLFFYKSFFYKSFTTSPPFL
jgi:hypothetical protein